MKGTDPRQVLGLLLGMMLFVGCGPAADGYSGPRGTLAGRLTIDGKPLQEGCQILLMATRGNYTAAGLVEGDGRYTARYRVPQGLPVGDYAIQLGLPSDFQPPGVVGDGQPLTAVDLKRIERAWKASLPFPQRYMSANTSGLTLTVQPGENVADFDITKKVDQAGNTRQ